MNAVRRWQVQRTIHTFYSVTKLVLFIRTRSWKLLLKPFLLLFFNSSLDWKTIESFSCSTFGFSSICSLQTSFKFELVQDIIRVLSLPDPELDSVLFFKSVFFPFVFSLSLPSSVDNLGSAAKINKWANIWFLHWFLKYKSKIFSFF